MYRQTVAVASGIGAMCGRGLFLGFAVALGTPAAAQAPTAQEIVERVENLLWGETVQGEYEMTITTPRWQRTLALRAWIERPRRSFIRILAPAKEKGTLGVQLFGGSPGSEYARLNDVYYAQLQWFF